MDASTLTACQKAKTNSLWRKITSTWDYFYNIPSTMSSIWLIPGDRAKWLKTKWKIIILEDKALKNKQTETHRGKKKQHWTVSKEYVHTQNSLIFLCYWSLRRKRESKKIAQRITFEETIAEDFPNWWRTFNYRFRKLYIF